METLESWITNITLFELLDWAPHGFLIGCGGTAEYFNYMFRIRPSTIEQFNNICRQHLYFNSSINEKHFEVTEITEFLIELDIRLKTNEYAQVSFMKKEQQNNTNKEKIDNDEVFKSIFIASQNPGQPNLFDHSFIITQDYWRFESYINKYEPRRIHWPKYKNDIKELFQNPYKKWKEIFGVKCDKNYDLSEIYIIINN